MNYDYWLQAVGTVRDLSKHLKYLQSLNMQMILSFGE